MANTFALITKLEGQAWIRDADGNLQPLRVGMRIPMDAEIITAAGAQLALQGGESGTLQVAESRQLKLTEDLFKTADPTESALTNPADADVNALITALNQGQDPLAQLDPTAATLAGGDGAGSTYVRLSSVIENTTPLALQYPRSVATQTADFISGGVIEPEAPAPQAPAPQAGIGSDAKTVYEAGLGQEANTATTSGSIAVSASDGISSITIGGVSFTLAQLLGDVGLLPSVNTGEGTLRITGYTPGANNQAGTVSYEYTLNEAQPHAPGADNNTLEDPVEVTVTGNSGSTAGGSIVITIVDDVPQAKSDAFTQATENAAVTGDVLANNGSGADVFGADGKGAGTGQVTLVAGSLTGAGNLLLNPNGTFTYTPSQGEEGVVTFKYTIKDGDADASEATVTITLKADSVPTVTVTPSVGGDNSVLEAGLSTGSNPGASKTATGTLDITTGGDSVGKLEIQGSGGLIDVTNGGTVQGAFGVLTVTKTGSVYSYSYTLTTATTDVDAVPERDNFAVKITDSDGDEGTATLAITIVDDVPQAKSESESVAEGGSLTVDAAHGVLANDKAGADGWDAAGGVVGVSNGATSVTTANSNGAYVIQGQYGQLTLGKDGSYTYQATAAVASDKQDVFTYTVKDGDGDTTTAQLNITVNNVDQKPVVNDIDRSAQESSRTETKSNVVLTIDLSGSMGDPSGVAGKTRLDLVKEAVSELLNSGGVNAVFITTFSSGTYATNNKALNGGQWYTTAQLQQAILDVDALSANGGTNYDGALTSVMNYVNAAGAFPGGAGKNVSVFMSDGEPVNGAVGTAKETQWINWLSSKNFSDAYAIGFGGLTSTNANNLEPIAWKAGEVQGTNTTAAQDDHVILSDVTALKDALLQTVLSPGAVLTGDLKVEGGNTSGDGWNSTGGAVVGVVTFGAQSHTFTSATDTFTFDLGAVGKVIFKGDGTYTFTANNATDVNAALSAALTYTLKDADGSVSNPAKLVFTLTDRSEVSATDDSKSVSLAVSQSATPEWLARSFSTTEANNGTQSWKYSSSKLVDLDTLTGSDKIAAVLAGSTDSASANWSNWYTSSLSGNSKDAAGASSNSVLRLTDSNGATNGDAQLLTPTFTATYSGQKLSFTVTPSSYRSGDTVSWTLYKQASDASWSAVPGQVAIDANGGKQTITTTALDSGVSYRVLVTVHDGSGGNNYYVSLDDFSATALVAAATTTTGNVLTNDSPGSEGASLWMLSEANILTKVAVGGMNIVGEYGTLNIKADGTYTYTTNTSINGSVYQTQKDIFDYHLVQADGDTATAQLTFTINASGVGVINGNAPEIPSPSTPLPGNEVHATAGLDTLIGTAGNDLFIWQHGDAGTVASPNLDVVKSFGTAGNDKLVLGDLLQGEEHTSDLSKFLHFETQAGTAGTVNTVIKVSTSGNLAADGSGYNQQIVVEGVDLTGTSHDQNTMIKDLIDQGKLKLDHS